MSTPSLNTSAAQGLAVVTGASVGIGRASAEALEKAGYAVIAASRRLTTVASAATGITTHQLDVTDADSVAALERTVAAHPLPLTLLVNNAGIPTHAATIADSDITDWRATYDTNVIGVVQTTQALLPYLIRNRGDVQFIGSTVGRVGYERGRRWSR
uniref:SDR family oxidoreductase n=1 Tax=Streptomyces graminilatus TaxID=1464070 RepID=UPI000B0AC315